MSGENPIPERLHIEFAAYVEMADNESLPDGAWWAVLEDTCRMFMEQYGIKGDPFEATHQYLRLNYPDDEQEHAHEC